MSTFISENGNQDTLPQTGQQAEPLKTGHDEGMKTNGGLVNGTATVSIETPLAGATAVPVPPSSQPPMQREDVTSSVNIDSNSKTKNLEILDKVCPHCPRKFHYQTELTRHLILMHKDHATDLLESYEAWVRQKSIKSQIKKKSNSGPRYILPKPKPVQSKPRRTVKKPSCPTCNICGKSFRYFNDNQTRLDSHMLSVHNIVNPSSNEGKNQDTDNSDNDECGKKGNKSSGSTRNLRNRKPAKSGKETSSTSTTDSNWSCSVCHLNAGSSNGLTEHITTSHYFTKHVPGNPIKFLVCNACMCNFKLTPDLDVQDHLLNCPSIQAQRKRVGKVAKAYPPAKRRKLGNYANLDEPECLIDPSLILDPRSNLDEDLADPLEMDFESMDQQDIKIKTEPLENEGEEDDEDTTGFETLDCKICGMIFLNVFHLRSHYDMEHSLFASDQPREPLESHTSTKKTSTVDLQKQKEMLKKKADKRESRKKQCLKNLQRRQGWKSPVDVQEDYTSTWSSEATEATDDQQFSKVEVEMNSEVFVKMENEEENEPEWDTEACFNVGAESDEGEEEEDQDVSKYPGAQLVVQVGVGSFPGSQASVDSYEAEDVEEM